MGKPEVVWRLASLTVALTMAIACFAGAIKTRISADLYPAVAMYPIDGTFAGCLWVAIGFFTLWPMLVAMSRQRASSETHTKL